MNVVKQDIMRMTVQDTEVVEVEGTPGLVVGRGLVVGEVTHVAVPGAVIVVEVVAETEVVTDMEAVTVAARIDMSVVRHPGHDQGVHQETMTNGTVISDSYITFHPFIRHHFISTLLHDIVTCKTIDLHIVDICIFVFRLTYMLLTIHAVYIA